jgi:hypothetical protein
LFQTDSGELGISIDIHIYCRFLRYPNFKPS